MPLQNRVDPFGAVHAVAARGLFTGNRGIIHDPERRTLLARRWTNRAWIICRCDWKGRRRTVMGRNGPKGGPGWTELFFLDEATALAAGHRPCFACRREAARRFADAFADAFGIAAPKAGEIDRRLHRERWAVAGPPAALAKEALPALPDGAMVAEGTAAFAVRGGALWPWRFEGYGAPKPIIDAGPGEWRLITPATTVAILAAGYRPVWHQAPRPA